MKSLLGLLILFSVGVMPKLFAGDVVVTPPGVGIVRVLGEVGHGQTPTLYIFRCEVDPDYVLKKHSCLPIKEMFEINTSISLPEGLYTVIYNHTIKNDVNIRAGEEITIQLSKIKVPDANTATRFRAFVDITDVQEMDKVLLDYWSSVHGKAFSDRVCSISLYKDICSAINASPAALRGVLVDADEQAREHYLSIKPDGSGRIWNIRGRRWINLQSEMGGFVSVLPGVYGVEFLDAAGVTGTKYGIMVK